MLAQAETRQPDGEKRGQPELSNFSVESSAWAGGPPFLLHFFPLPKSASAPLFAEKLAVGF
jgi:hypothetical protein